MLHLRLESLTRGGALALLQVTLLDALRLRLMVTLSLIHFFLRLSLCVHTFDETMLHSASTGCRTLQREQHTSIGWHLLLQKCLLRHDFKYCIIMRLYPCYDDIGTLSSPLLSSPLHSLASSCSEGQPMAKTKSHSSLLPHYGFEFASHIQLIKAH